MSLPELLVERATGFIPVLLSLTVHEWAHAWTAWNLGDDTARMMGRVSLNPIDHIDPVGTLLLPLMGVPFGWAKPVPINPIRFRPNVNMAMGVLLTAAAGPISNLCLAALSWFALAGLARFSDPVTASGHHHAAHEAVCRLLESLVLINIVLACFNLLPIPPLDGSRIVDALVPDSMRPYWNSFSALAPLLLAAVILLPVLAGFSLLSWPIYWANSLLRSIR
jgi:Zn-dependent protease